MNDENKGEKLTPSHAFAAFRCTRKDYLSFKRNLIHYISDYCLSFPKCVVFTAFIGEFPVLF